MASPTRPELTAEPRARERLDWIEAGRGLAALGVVLSHFTPWHDAPPWSPYTLLRGLGGCSVEFFFVLSGFIILYVHQRDLGQPAALAHYARRRLVRIVPTYWLVLALSLLVNQTVQIAWARVALTPNYLVHQILLLPGDQMVGQAWTLRHELLFYAAFALLIVRVRLGLAVFALWMALALGNLIVNGLPPGQVSTPDGIVLLHYNLDFAIGMGIALAARANRLGVVIVAGLTGAAVAFAISLYQPGLIWTVVLLKPLFAAIVAAAVLISRRGIPVPRALIALGSWSYALYLSHELFGTMVTGFFRRVGFRPPEPVLLGLRVTVALIAGALIYRYFERPVLRRLNRPRRASVDAAHPVDPTIAVRPGNTPAVARPGDAA